MNKLSLPVLLLMLLYSSSCRQNQYTVNVNDIETELSIFRFDKEFFGSDPATFASTLDELKKSHTEFLRIFGYVLNIGDIDDPDWNSNLMSFITDKQNVKVYQSVAAKFTDLAKFEEELTTAWKHYLYYFPESEVPDIYTCTSGFNNSLIIGDNVIGISLDRYLGHDSEYYPMLGIYNYQSRLMVPAKIVSDCMYGWAASTWEPEDNNNRNLLETMLHEGQLLYFTRSMVPNASDTLLFGFSEMQLNFARNNEQQMWEYLVEHDMLFSTDPMLIMKLTREAPFTSFFTSESPGKAANWLGFKIIESFMGKNSGVDLSELMTRRDYQKILELSRYSPG